MCEGLRCFTCSEMHDSDPGIQAAFSASFGQSEEKQADELRVAGALSSRTKGLNAP